LAIGKKIDGIILCPCQKDQSSIEMLKSNGVPFVLIGRRFPRDDIDYVLADDAEGGYLATRHLIETGRRRVLFLNGPGYISSARERLAGYRRALEEQGMPYACELVREVAIKVGECTRVLREVVEQKLQFSGVMCFSDLMAWEAIYQLQSLKMRVPEDVAVVGFDDIQSRLFYPYPLSSVGYSKRGIARKAVGILLNKIGGPGYGAGPSSSAPPAFHQELTNVRIVRRRSS
jgi:LacI family transcriptional regulator